MCKNKNPSPDTNHGWLYEKLVRATCSNSAMSYGRTLRKMYEFSAGPCELQNTHTWPASSIWIVGFSCASSVGFTSTIRGRATRPVAWSKYETMHANSFGWPVEPP